MSSLLPVLANESPAMRLCQACPKPGVCCNNFNLNVWGYPDTWRAEAEGMLKRHNLPFSIRGGQADSGGAYGGLVRVVFGCDHVTPEGRCGIYETRPWTCSSFLPGSDELCVFHKNHQAFQQELSNREPLPPKAWTVLLYGGALVVRDWHVVEEPEWDGPCCLFTFEGNPITICGTIVVEPN